MVERRVISLPSQLQLLERLQHLIYLSSSMLLLSGEKGAGKSTISEQLANKLPKQLQQVYLSLSAGSTVKKLRQQLITQLFNDPLFNPDDPLVDTFQRLNVQQPEHGHRLIIIDNAKHLPEPFFIELCELLAAIQQSQRQLNLLLLTEPKVVEALLGKVETELASNLAKKVEFVELTVEALPYKEAEALLQHCFQEQGYQAQLQHQDALQQQISSCMGNPHKLIKLAERLSVGNINSANPSWLKSTLPSLVLMLFLTVIVVLLGKYLYTHFIDNNDSLQSIEVSKQPDYAEQVPKQLSQADGAAKSDETSEVLAGKWQQKSEALQLEQSSSESQKTINTAHNSNEHLAELPEEQETQVEQEAPLLTIKNETLDGQPVNVLNKPISNSEATTSTSPQQLEQQETSSQQQAQQLTPEQDSAQPQLPLLSDTKLLLAKSQNNYTLQLSGMASLQSLTRFANKHQLPQDNVFVYQTIRNNEPWYVVIYGEYDTIRSAQLAAKNLPASFSKINAWVKSWKTVHSDLRLTNE